MITDMTTGATEIGLVASMGHSERAYSDETGGGPMAGKTVTRAELSEAVYQKAGLSRSEAAKLVEGVLEGIGATLAAGEDVKLSSFGSFLVRNKGERVGRNPKTGVEVPIHSRRAVSFKPSNVLKAHVNGEIIDGED
jgi:integration host factor subunit alpha